MEETERRKPGNRTGVVRDERFLLHDPGYGHVESPARLKVIHERLDSADARPLYVTIEPRPATWEELSWNHDPTYIGLIEKTEKRFIQFDPDTGAGPGSWNAATLAAGGVMTLMDAITNGTVENGLALVRPPGHHAERDHAMGFCLFNNIAIGAHYARRVLGLGKILIVDWDLHHGNGTQHSFYKDPSVLYISTHQSPCYPGSGLIDQVGEGAGRGFTVNIPMPAGSGDSDYASVFNRVVIPVATSFSPDLILVSAGFDIHHDDPLGGMKVTGNGIAYLARSLVELAERICRGRILFCLEGGYSREGLREGIFAVLSECAKVSPLDPGIFHKLAGAGSGPGVVDAVIETQKGFWPGVFMTIH